MQIIIKNKNFNFWFVDQFIFVLFLNKQNKHYYTLNFRKRVKAYKFNYWNFWKIHQKIIERFFSISSSISSRVVSKSSIFSKKNLSCQQKLINFKNEKKKIYAIIKIIAKFNQDGHKFFMTFKDVGVIKVSKFANRFIKCQMIDKPLCFSRKKICPNFIAFAQKNDHSRNRAKINQNLFDNQILWRKIQKKKFKTWQTKWLTTQ